MINAKQGISNNRTQLSHSFSGAWNKLSVNLPTGQPVRFMTIDLRFPDPNKKTFIDAQTLEILSLIITQMKKKSLLL